MTTVDPRLTDALVSAMRPTLELALAKMMEEHNNALINLVVDTAIGRYVQHVLAAVAGKPADRVLPDPEILDRVIKALEEGPAEIEADVFEMWASDVWAATGKISNDHPEPYDLFASVLNTRFSPDNLAEDLRATEQYRQTRNVELQWVDTTDQANPRILTFDEVETLGLHATGRNH